MSEHIDEQISEFIDDELSVDQCEFFVRRLQRDREARARYLRYQLIGAAVRGEHLAINAALAGQAAGALAGQAAGALAGQAAGTPAAGEAASDSAATASVRQRLAAGTNQAAAGAGGRLTAISRHRVALIGGVAASLALAAVVIATLPGLDGIGGEFFASDSVAGTAGGGDEFAGSRADVMGMQYVIQHTGFTSGLSRTNMHSSVIAGPLFDTVEDTITDADQ